MVAIVDCNSFYCSCERLFRPDLRQKPVVVLSNNDGCIIARSDEAKALGLSMAGPYYQQRDAILQHGVAVFSSNYNLYGDLSMRVMDTLRTVLPPSAVEVYSVDEAFLDLSGLPPSSFRLFAAQLRQTVETWTGIQVSVGVAPTKVLAKVANRLAKKDKLFSQCVRVLDKDDEIREVLDQYDVAELWGIGRRYADKLKNCYGITTASQLMQMPEDWARKNLGGVVGVRMIRELNGKPSFPMKDPLEQKKMISTTRMFGKAVYKKEELREAVATFVSRAAEKLRRQGFSARYLDVFVVTNGKAGEQYHYDPRADHRYMMLPRATSFTQEIIGYAMPLVDDLYREGQKYLKAGVTLSMLVPDAEVQSNLFEAAPAPHQRALMEAVDNLNFSMRGDLVKYAASGLERNWKMRQEMKSRRLTTRWEELFEVR